MVRASHTLCGIHRTGGFPVVATAAKALEQALIGLEQHAAPMPSATYPILARAIAALRSLVDRVKQKQPFAKAMSTKPMP
jgi:chemotaxis protein histidine kinase CheA